MTKLASFLLLFGILPLLLVGCGKKEEDPETQLRKGELTEVYEMYSYYLKKNQQPPMQLSDLTTQDFESIYPTGTQVLKEGKYVAVWGIGDKSSGTVLAFEKDAADKGGAVLMADGTVKMMSASEFQAAYKPAK